MVKIGDLVKPKGVTDSAEVYRVSGIKSNFQGVWITLSTVSKSQGVKAYPLCNEKVWMRSQDYDVLKNKEETNE